MMEIPLVKWCFVIKFYVKSEWVVGGLERCIHEVYMV